jgi:chaperonin GroEL
VKERTDRVDDNARHQGRGRGGDSARRWGCVAAGKVVRTALQDAASIAGLLITTEATVAEIPKKQAAMLAMPPGGGMDY